MLPLLCKETDGGSSQWSLFMGSAGTKLLLAPAGLVLAQWARAALAAHRVLVSSCTDHKQRP